MTVRTPSAAALLGAALLGLGGPAGPGRAADQPPAGDLGQRRPVGPDAELGGSLEARRSAEEAGPRLAFEQFRFAVELQVSGKRREEMADLQKLIKLGGSAQELPGWIFRLAELHWEEAQYDFFEANRKDDQAAQLGERPDPRALERLKGEKRDLEDRSRVEQEEAIRLYRDIVRRWPAYPRLDEVLFFLGENLWRQQRRRDALEAYKQLITRFPQSRYVPDAWMAFGEYYFDAAEKGSRNENLAKALESYKRTAAHAESSIYGFALYKQGWVHYNLADWAGAADMFRAVVLFGELPTSTIAPQKKIALVREARKDYVRTYSHFGPPASARDDFKRVGGEEGWLEMLRGLAGLYFEEGKDREAVLIHRQLLEIDPLGPEAPLYQSRIVTSAGRQGRKDVAARQAQVFVKMLRDIDAAGPPKDARARQALASARADAENTLRTLAVSYHNEYRKTRDAPVGVLAADVYKAWLDLFPEASPAYSMRFFAAELLFALERYQEAGDRYAEVARLDAARAVERPPRPPGKYQADALEAAVHAYDLVLRAGEKPAAAGAEEAARARPGEPRPPLPLSRPQQQLLDACEAYLKGQPAGAKRVEIAYKAANIDYRSNRFPEAVKLFSAIALEQPDSELAAYSANLVLDSLNLQGDWRGMSDWAQRFWNQPALLKAHPSLRDDLARVIEQSAFKVVGEMEKERRFGAAADAYLAFAKDWPASPLASTALFNASVDLVRAGQLDRALEVRGRMLKLHPADPLAPQVLLADARDREAAGDFEQAAEAAERYFAGWRKEQEPVPAPRQAAARGKKAPPPAPAPAAAKAAHYEEARAQDALFNAGVFREAVGQPERAAADRQAYVETWPSAPEASRVFLSVADLHARADNREKEVRQLEAWQRRFGAAPADWLAAQARIVRAWDRAGNREAARAARVAALAFYRKNGLDPARAGERGLPPVAEGMLLELEPAFAAWDRITLDVKPKLIKAQLDMKANRLRGLEKQYGEVVLLKAAEPAVCALTRIGTLYERMARTILDAPVPKEFRSRADVVKEYRTQLAAFAEAPSQKALEGMELAAAKSRELGVGNDCSRAAEVYLARVKPDRHGPVLEKIPEIAAPAPPEHPVGYGLLGSLQAFEARRRAEAGPAPAARPAPGPAARPGKAAERGREEPKREEDDEDLLK